MERKHKGAASELIALIWLLKEGYEVYRNVSSHGIADMVAIKDDEILKIDVKTNSKLTTSYPSKEQVKNGIKLLVVDLDNEKILGWAREGQKQTVTCKVCGKTEQTCEGIGWSIYCSEECRKPLRNQYHRELSKKRYQQKKEIPCHKKPT